jgi:cytidyltransferase-like protein
MSFTFHHATVAGTFDHFHIGHKSLIDKAFAVAERVSLGITTEELLVDKRLRQSLESYKTRERVVKKYIEEKEWISRVEFFPLPTVEGIALTDKSLDSIIVSPESEDNARLINSQRKQRGLTELSIVTTPFILGKDGHIIRSSRIRSGQIERSGDSYLSFLQQKKLWTLPQSIRPLLQKPMGKIITAHTENDEAIVHKTVDMISSFQPPLVISVGDVVTNNFLRINYRPGICILDGRTQRRTFSSDITHVAEKRTCTNEAGTISIDAIQSLQESITQSVEKQKYEYLSVSGEEDLLGLPAILLSPLQSLVFYGQYDLGMVMVKVTEESKAQIKALLNKFS